MLVIHLGSLGHVLIALRDGLEERKDWGFYCSLETHNDGLGVRANIGGCPVT